MSNLVVNWKDQFSCIASHMIASFPSQELCIDIMDRDPTDNPGGIPYKLLAEACIPSINVDDVGAIFEEHRVCRNLSVWQHSNQVGDRSF